jgi:hypothetical protein
VETGEGPREPVINQYRLKGQYGLEDQYLKINIPNSMPGITRETTPMPVTRFMPVAQFLIRGWNRVALFVAQFFDAV